MVFEPTDEQKAILAHDPKQHARILAGPGTGKSATVIAFLNAKARNIDGRAKLLTFTRAATAELVLKLKESEEIVCERPSTLHSFCIAVLLQNLGLGEFPRPLRMADDWERDNIVEETLSRRLGVPKLRVRDLFGELAANWESLAPEEAPKVTAEQRARFMGGWHEHREILGYTLPSELPFALRTALREHGELQGTDYVLLVVDEYQDLNSCDLDVLKGLAERGCAIIGAGDDDQSIYSFRKAHPEGIRRFPQDYNPSGDYPLSIKQRCGKAIVQWANYVIQGDPGRPARRGALNPAAAAPDGEVGLFSFKSESAEAAGVANIAGQLINENRLAASEVLILLRSDHNGQFSRKIKEELTRKEIPFSDPSTIKELMEEDTSRNAMSRLHILLNKKDSLAWVTLLLLTPGIGDTFFDNVYEKARGARSSFADALLRLHEEDYADVAPAVARRVKASIYEILGWREQVVVPETQPEDGWGNWITNAMQDSGSPLSDALSSQLTDVVDEIAEPTDDLGRYLSQIWPLSKDVALAKSNGVRIMTLGASKGLTVDAAIIAGLENGIIPMDGNDLSEERRLLYVGMTRAKRFLIGTWARRRKGPTARAGRTHTGLRQVSQFLDGGPVGTTRID